ncbi:Protein Brevis radix-like 1 [Vitis vinifera]|nr:Protein Brevis radix-like 1 [Vitis vinifera]
MAERLPVGAVRNSKSPPFSSISPTPLSDVSTVATEQICGPITFHESDSMGSNCVVISNGSSTSSNHSSYARVGHSEAIIRNKNKTDAEPYQGVEWVEQDEPGVYITLVSLPGGVKDLKRVRFSRKRFSEKQAEQWWAANRVRVYQQYNVPLVDKSCIGIGREGLAH